uniref:Uncharacterized protein n=1 Tax=Podoviridae sp. ct8mF2 TaxID=2825224 RepID=A0A8S5PMF1_9CAUD|nr:MAG TPA: hypothetical protein [Podoviridae sp. ct8mF2]
MRDKVVGYFRRTEIGRLKCCFQCLVKRNVSGAR